MNLKNKYLNGFDSIVNLPSFEYDRSVNAHRSQKRARADQFALKERSEKKVMKIENKEHTILGLLANFEHDWSVHARTGVENVRAQTSLH